MFKKTITIIITIFMTAFCFAQSQLEMNQQAFKDYQKADAEMTRVYNKVQKTLTLATEKKLLLDAQRAWIKYKEAHCKSVAEAYNGGSMRPMIYAGCLRELTEERTKSIKKYLETN
jgi:uncharacterized protein YecT (DUF1311 family)